MSIAGKRIAITRPEAQGASLISLLMEKGGEPFSAPLIEILPCFTPAALKKILTGLREHDWCVFTSANGVHLVLQFAKQERLLEQFRDVKLACIGSATEHELSSWGLKATLVPEVFRAEGLVAAFERHEMAGKKVLLLRAKEARPVLRAELIKHGARVEEVQVYEAIPSLKGIAKLRSALDGQKVDCITFTSGSTVHSFKKHLGDLDVALLRQGVKLASIGPITTQALRIHGLWADIEAKVYTAEGLSEAITSLYQKNKTEKNSSAAWFERGQAVIPGGVNSPVRAFGSVGGTPAFIRKGFGSRIWDEDGREYIDYVNSWGALILGHAHPKVIEAVQDAASNGLTYGAATAREVLLAELICSAIPSIEKVRLVSSGTEATMTAIRLARAFTGRDKILKFEGCYHGHSDSFLVKAGSGLLTFGNPSSGGLTSGVVNDTLVAQYNEFESLEQAFSRHGKELACVIVEPVAANMGVVLPRPGFLEKLSQLCQTHKSLLIFDEVITGFRFHFGGYQEVCKMKPDLTCLGKIVGGGLPLAAVGGRAKILDLLAPLGSVYQAGTLSGNPLATAAGLATLHVLQEENPYLHLDLMAQELAQGIRDCKRDVAVNQIGSLLTLFFKKPPIETFDQVMSSNRKSYQQLFGALLSQGVYLPPSPFEAWFLSAAHTEKDITSTLDAISS